MSNLKGILRGGYYNYLYFKKLNKLNINRNQIIILATIAKSGTHYFKFLLSNYINLMSDRDAKPMTPNEVNNFFPNIWHKCYSSNSQSIQSPSKKPMKFIGYFDMPRTHVAYDSRMNGSKILHLYRNPLDYCVSMYFYKYVNNPKFKNKLKSPYEVFEKEFEKYIFPYISYRKQSFSKNNYILRISYEDFIIKTEIIFKIILNWLGVEVDIELLEKAIFSSSKATLKRMEKKEPIHTNRKNLKGSFLRSGKIGEWKNYFSDEQLNNIKKKLLEFNISLDEFIIS